MKYGLSLDQKLPNKFVYQQKWQSQQTLIVQFVGITIFFSRKELEQLHVGVINFMPWLMIT